MKNLKLGVLIIIVLFIGIGCSRGGVDTPVGPSTVTPKVYLDPSVRSVSNGSQFTLNVYVENVTNLYFASVYIVYDPAKVSYVSSAEGNFLSGASTGFYPPISEVSAGSGLVKRAFGVTRTGARTGSNGVSGSGNLFSVTFKAVAGSTGTTDISFSSDPNDLGFNDSTAPIGNPISITVGNGTAVTIQ